MFSNKGTTTSLRKAIAGWIIGSILILVLLGIFVFPLFGVGVVPGNYGYYGGYYPRPFFFFPFGFLIFFFVIFFVGRWLFWGWGWGRGHYRGYWHYGAPSEILKQRYARGEITKEQFDQMMRDIQQHN